MKKKANPKILWQLFTSMFLLSSCTFGGGFVIVSLMKKKFVDEKKWLEEDEMLDITAITQSSPGPLPVNASVIIGYRMAGIAGSLTAIAGTILPPMIIISLISLCYEQFRTNEIVALALQVTRAGVAAVILDVTLNLAGNIIKLHNAFYLGMMILCFIAVVFFNVSAMAVILTCLAVLLAEAVSSPRSPVKSEGARVGGNASGPISRVLSLDDHLSRTPVARRL